MACLYCGGVLPERKKKFCTKSCKDKYYYHNFNKRDQWSLSYNSCVSCNSIERPHHAKGYCKSCYEKRPEYLESARSCKKSGRGRELKRQRDKKHYDSNTEKRVTASLRSYYANHENHKLTRRKYMAKIRIDKNEDFFKRPLEYWGNRYHLIHKLNKKCAVCGCGENLETHHITPVSKGGSHEIENLIVICREHHRGKNGVHGSKYRDMTDSHHVIKLLRNHIEA